jgi:hypothetical protein
MLPRVTAFSDAFLRLGEVSKGKALLLRSLQIKIDRHGKKSPLVAAAMVHLSFRWKRALCASSCDTLQVTIATALEASKAKEFLVKALAIQEACYGEGVPRQHDHLVCRSNRFQPQRACG